MFSLTLPPSPPISLPISLSLSPYLCRRHGCRNVYVVWRSYLEGTVQVSQSRLNVCDNYKGQVSDPAKTLRLYKEQQLKKVGASDCSIPAQRCTDLHHEAAM